MRKELIVKNKKIGKGKPMICVSVMETEIEGIVAEIQNLIAQGVEMIEWRVDAFDGVESIIIAITLTHADHVAGLGTLIWQCNSVLNIKPKIISNSNSFESHLRQLLRLLGVEEKLFEFVGAEAVQVDGCKIEMQPTTHTPILEAFGIMFSDSRGKYYYTGDTNDFEYVKNLAQDENVKKIYCEVSRNACNVHLVYDRLKEIKSNKLVLMHFENIDLYNLAKTDGFNVAVINR